MASFGKVDRYVSPTLWNPIAGTPARQLAGDQLTHAAMAPAGGSAPPADPDGRLTLQTRLPGERELAAALNVSRTTIASALGQLREEGFLYSRQGAGHALFCRNAPPIFLCLPASHLRLIYLPPPSAPGRRSIRPSSTL